jgi:FtsH-binding integral membrane protein
VVAGLEPPSLPVTITVVLSGFGPFVVGGGFRLDQAALMKVYGDRQTARTQVVGLIALEWAVLAPFACLSAIVLLITGANVMGSLLWPWAVCVPAGFALGLWLTVPERSRSLLRRFGSIAPYWTASDCCTS